MKFLTSKEKIRLYTIYEHASLEKKNLQNNLFPLLFLKPFSLLFFHKHKKMILIIIGQISPDEAFMKYLVTRLFSNFGGWERRGSAG